jgi:hypothetical protein
LSALEEMGGMHDEWVTNGMRLQGNDENKFYSLFKTFSFFYQDPGLFY